MGIKIIGIFSLRISILLFLLLPELSGFGQEYIRDIINLKGKNSVIRELDKNNILVASNIDDTIVFTQYDETNTTAISMKFKFNLAGQYTAVSDFEIYKDTVYFVCTKAIFDDEYQEYVYCGYMGYFPLNGFPNTQVEYIKIENGHANKLAVYSEVTAPFFTHVIMTARNQSFGFSYLVDARRVTSTDWKVCYSILDGDDYVDDVDVTDNYVVATSRKPDLTYQYRVWLMNKPLGGYSALDFCNGYFKFSSPMAIGRLYVKHCTADGFVAVAKSYPSTLFVQAYDAASITNQYLGTVTIPLSTVFDNAVDLKFNNNTISLDVLCNNPYYTDTLIFPREQHNSIIYKFTVPNLTSLATVERRTYYDELINSLEYSKSHANVFYGSGAPSEDSQLRIYKYTEPYYSDCSIQSFVGCNQFHPDVKLDEWKLSYECFIKKATPATPWEAENPIEFICE